MKRFQFSFRTVAIFVTVFCCLLGTFPVSFGSTPRVTGMWIQSPRFCPPSQPMIGFVREQFSKQLTAYYVCVWCYDGTSVPAAVAYLSDTAPARPVAFNQSDFQFQTMRFPLTRGWKIALSIVALLLFGWYPISGCRRLTRGKDMSWWWLFRFILGLAATDAMACCLLMFTFKR